MIRWFRRVKPRLIGRLAEEERGATAVEYALVASLIVVGIITSVAALESRVGGTFNQVVSTWPS
jgi:Flp pilus assembly pilin Flp